MVDKHPNERRRIKADFFRNISQRTCRAISGGQGVRLPAKPYCEKAAKFAIGIIALWKHYIDLQGVLLPFLRISPIPAWSL
jgi:hypothetical protein